MKLRRYLPYLFAERRLMLAAAGMMVAGAAANLLSPWPVTVIVDNILGGRPIFGFHLGAQPHAYILLAALLYFACIFLRGFFNHQSHASVAILAEKLELKLGRDLFVQTLALPVAFHDGARLGDLGVRLNEDVGKLKEAWIEGFSLFAVEALTFLGIAGILFVIDWRFTCLALAVLAPLFSVFGRFPGRIQDQTRLSRDAESAKASLVQEVLATLRLVKAHAEERHERNRWLRQSHANLRRQKDLVLLEGRFTFVVEIFTAIGLSAVTGYGAWRVASHTLTLGEMLLFLQYLTILYTPVGRLSRLVAVIQKAMASLARIDEIFAQMPERSPRLAGRPPRAEAAISVRGVQFAYPGRARALDGVDLEIAAGEKVALIGETGAGKSSLLHLLLRFHEPQAGEIRIGGRPLASWDLGELRRQITLLSQESQLRQGTLYSNLVYGCGKVSPAQVEAAARAAGAHDFIERLPNGYQSTVGERGVSLSGGERQRLAIARALLRNTPILIMDEPTSAVDERCEDGIRDALALLLRDKTVLFTTHRRNLLQLATRVVRLQDGMLLPN